ncbi:MAG: radical SAM protein [Syntrophales bacterium LBB04]|nr:radical SAM protein [Syntrophales bacterium LBB04]
MRGPSGFCGTQPMNGAISKPGEIFIVDPSKRCEPSAFLFTKAVSFFLVNGYGMAKDIDRSEIILVNTCCVTEDKIATSRAALDFARARGNGKRVVLFGCMASLPLPGLEREDLICIGPKSVGELDIHFPHHTSVNSISANQLSPALYTPGQGLNYGDYFLMIAQGCTNRCSYCNIKRAKGEVRSEPLEAILLQLWKGLSCGARDFALLADDCASYGHDVGTDLVDLMEQLFTAGPGFSLKLGYVYPQFLLTHFNRLGGAFETGRIRYVNIPMQSGSQRILELMNRRYNVDAVMEVVRQLRAIAPETTFCTHMMVNFPTESHDDFLRSLAVADGFDEVLFLHYSDNQGTAAGGLLPKVPEPEVRRRLDMASDYANRCKPDRSAVIKDFNCDTPYNMLGAIKG